MRIAVVGGGLFGCLSALRMSRNGHKISIFERSGKLLAGASRNNEGKVHHGFTYGLDPSGKTQRLMFSYGQHFIPDLSNLLNVDASKFLLHRKGLYAIHASSKLSPAGVSRHFGGIADLYLAHLAEFESDCSSGSAVRGQPVRQLSSEEVSSIFGADIADAYEVCEPTVDCIALCEYVHNCIESNPGIKVVLQTEVKVVLHEAGPIVQTSGGDKQEFDRVINCSWDGLTKIERLSGRGATIPPMCLRAKAGFIASVEGLPNLPVSIGYGSFGDIVPLGHGLAYASWYPACLMGFTTATDEGPAWFERIAKQFDFARAYRETVRAFTELVPGLSFSEGYESVRAGAILAAAQTDIDDPNSALHRRYDLGIYRSGKVFCVNTGKLACIPRLVTELCQAIG